MDVMPGASHDVNASMTALTIVTKDPLKQKGRPKAA
jgi:hypothetical protein